MTISVLLAPPGAGKTEAALRRVALAARAQPFARIWVLVSGARQKDSFRERLAQRAGPGGVFFNIEFFTFYELYPRLLKMAGQPARRLEDTARAALLRAVLADLRDQGALAVFGPIATTPGFVRVTADFIRELKQNRVEPETFLRAASQSARPKDRDLARVYADYQARLIAHNLVDRDGEGWLALSAVETGAVPLALDLLLVDGYDEFTPLQARLLLRLSAHSRHALITLATAPGREDTAGRRFTRALAELRRAAVETGTTLAIEPPAEPAPRQHPALAHLLAHAFRPGAPPVSAGGAVTFIEAPDAAREAAAVLRRVKRLLLDGCRADDILIALRDWPRYAGHFAALGAAYGVPLALHFSDTLARSPAVAALLQALDLPASGFRRRDLLDTLRSPYFAVPGLDAASVDRLERISRAFAVVGGRGHWLAAVAQAGGGAPPAEDADALITGADASALAAALGAFFDAVTPPARASLGAYVRWLDTLTGQDADPDAGVGDDASAAYTLNMPAQARREAAPDVAARDIAALDRLKSALRGLLAAQNLLGPLAGRDSLDADSFLDDLRLTAAATLVERGPGRAGQVLVTTVTDARGLPHRHVFIPGLSEGIFPAALAEDPLYLDTERQALSAAGVPLETAAERASDESLFLQLAGQARDTLTLSRPTVQDGAPWIASHLWRTAAQALADADDIVRAHRVPLGAAAGPADAASLAEAVLAAADGLSAAPPPAPAVAALYNWLCAAQPAAWLRISRARQAELDRLSRRPHNHYSGRLRDPQLVAGVAAALGPGHVWSASQFNDLGACGFHFFARRLLRLEALEEPEDALSTAALGTINHALLEAVYREIGQRGLDIAPQHLDTALTVLRAAAAPLLDDAPRRYRFPADARWQQERSALLRRLEALVRVDFSDASPARAVSAAPRQPYLLESSFALAGRAVTISATIDGQPERLRVAGFIDRMDRAGDGVIVIDYKTGGTKIPVKEMRAGRNFQMLVYLLAAQQLLAAQSDPGAPRRVLGGLFWHIRSRESSGEVRLDDADSGAALDEAQAHLERYISAARRGDFSVAPRKLENGRCTRYCEFAHLCRVGSTNRRKPEGAG